MEPVTIAPGRWLATSADMAEILKDFESSVVEPPKLGAFPTFRQLYKDKGMSVLVEPSKGEVLRDLFQFVSGVAWHFFLRSDTLTAKVGSLFLLYLLFHSQRPQCHAVPVTVELLEQLKQLREECMTRQVFLELPKILRLMVQGDMFSVGVRATYRNLFFDKHGHLVERKATTGPVPDTRAWHAMKAKSPQVQLSLPSSMSNLQEQIKDYQQDMSRRVDCLSEAQGNYVETLAKTPEPVAKSRRLWRRRLPESDDEPELVKPSGPRLEQVDGCWRKVLRKSEANQPEEVLGFEAAKATGARRLMRITGETALVQDA